MMRTLPLFTLTAMIAFAANSLLCRLALKNTVIDAASFTAIRLIAGALTLWLIVQIRRRLSGAANVQTKAQTNTSTGNWSSAFALFVYAAAFSYAYVSLSAATGALLLFGSVQATMIGVGLALGERLRLSQWLGLTCALGGLTSLLLAKSWADVIPPAISPVTSPQGPPSLLGAALMVCAGVAWGIYSLKGRKSAGNPIDVTAGNFCRAVPMALLLLLLFYAITYQHAAWSSIGAWAAVASGALASGVGYAVWYTVLPKLKASSAATVQLSVPVIAAVGGIVFLDEAITLGLVVASVAILGGIALVIANQKPAK